MKLCLTNIGPISNIQFDVNSDLTFVYGKNNIGKSYAITIMYLALKNFAFENRMSLKMYYDFNYLPILKFEMTDDISKISEHFENNDTDYDISDIMKSNFSKLINAIFVRNFESSLKSSFGDLSNLNNKITNKNFNITIFLDTFNFSLSEKDNKLIVTEINLLHPFICKKSQQHRKPRKSSSQTTLYYNTEKQINTDIQNHLGSIYRESVMSTLKILKNVYYLPASRSGLYRALNAFGQILVELSKKRSFLHQKIVLPSISEQDSDYFSTINEINLKRISTKYNDVAQNIENKLLKGEVVFDEKTKQIMFKPNNSDIRLELLGTSSMIAEVSPIVLFLKYIIGSDEVSRRKKEIESSPIIFIEEPEAHLHPEAQLILMECFAELVNQGAKLVITSHSNYIFSKLNNLIADKKINKLKIKGYQFIQTDKGSIYEELLISDIGLDDKNFIDTSETLYDEKIRIINAME